MEPELEPRAKPLSYKVKAMSRESPSQKGVNVLDYDLRTHWSTGTNNKEWILLELDEPCLLSQIRIYNKSVLEWEISVGLRYKPETFVRVRPRCEAPRRDMMYPMNYTPCKYVRISCLRGSPIAIYFIQLIGVSVPGLEPEFQPVVNYLLPQVVSHKQDSHDMHLQLLQDITSRLLVFLPQLESDLASFSEAAESEIRFLAMLVGPFYPILHIVTERASFAISDSESSKARSTSTITVSSNFEVQPRRSRSPSFLSQVAPSVIAFRPEVVFMLLRKAYDDSHLGSVCRTASAALHKLVKSCPNMDLTPVEDSAASFCDDDDDKTEPPLPSLDINDYSILFGEDFKIHADNWDDSYTSLLDIAIVEEAVLHILYACASEPSVCCKLEDNIADFWSAFPLIQALLPALQPLPQWKQLQEQVDENWSQWKQPVVQHALHQIITMLSSSVFRSLLHVSAGYLLSYSPSQVKTACVLVDLCSGPLSPWLDTVIVKIDLVIELLEDLLPSFQFGHQSASCARAALKCIILGMSGYVDDILGKYKETKHKLLFIVEMLEPFLDPALAAVQSNVAFGDIHPGTREKQEENCAIALNIIRTAVGRPGVLPSLESEWRQGKVAPSVLLSILVPHMTLPPEMDLCVSCVTKMNDKDSVSINTGSSILNPIFDSKSNGHDEADGKNGPNDPVVKSDGFEDADLLFAPLELKNVILDGYSFPEGFSSEGNCGNNKGENGDGKFSSDKSMLLLKPTASVDYYSSLEDYSHIISLDDCDKRASEFQCLAMDLRSQQATSESYDAAIDALLLAAECYINPIFMSTFRNSPTLVNQIKNSKVMVHHKEEITELAIFFKKNVNNMDSIPNLERKRDKVVIEILIQAAEWERELQKSKDEHYSVEDETKNIGCNIQISPIDMQSADAVTLLRHHQAAICHFLVNRLLTCHQNSLEVLMQILVFYMQSATELYCTPDHIIDIIIRYSEDLNKTIRLFCHNPEEDIAKSDRDKFNVARRSWVLLQRLVMASSGGDVELESSTVHCVNLVPLSSWISKIPSFARSCFPLARFIGWMAVANFAKQYLQGKLFFVLEISELMPLLSIFVDELLLADNAVGKGFTHFPEDQIKKKVAQFGHSQSTQFHVYPELIKFFPDICLQLQNYGFVILEATSLQLKSLPPASVSDGLCWLSDFCLSPFFEIEKHDSYKKSFPQCFINRAGRNAKAVLLYLLKAMVSEHMDNLVLEMPRTAQILVSLCKSSYCDVDFLDSVLHLLKPLFSYGLTKVTDGEVLVNNNCYTDYESLCFQELFDSIKQEKWVADGSGDKICQVPLVFFILGSLFPDFSLQRKKEILKSLMVWADFTSSEPTSAHLKAFQTVLSSFSGFISQCLESILIHYPDDELWRKVKYAIYSEETLKYLSSKLESITENAGCSKDYSGASEGSVNLPTNRTSCISMNEIEDLSILLEDLLSRIHSVINCYWKFHFQLGTEISVTSAKCCLLMKCLTSVSQGAANINNIDSTESHQISNDFSDIMRSGWQTALQALATMILTLQNNHCWQVSSVMLDYLFELPRTDLEGLLSNVCLLIKSFCCHAPRLSWRLRTDKWLSSLFGTDFYSFNRDLAPLIDLFSEMLGHSEPEQRSIALRHLGILVGLDTSVGVTKLSCKLAFVSATSESTLAISTANVSKIVSSTWDSVAVVASSDPLMLLRANAMALLSGFIPYADRSLLKSFFISADTLPGLGTKECHMQDPFLQLSLTLLACACIYSPVEDISLLHEIVWRKLEDMATSKPGLNGVERKLCQALCELKAEVVNAKGVLSEILSPSSPVKQSDANFQNTRESILQVLSSLTSVQSYFDFFAKTTDEETQEIEEAEIELDLLQKETALLRVPERLPKATPPFPIFPDYSRDKRLSKLKSELLELERSTLREEILARRQKKLLAARERRKLLDEATLREIEFLRELDKKKISETERDIERQRELEAERAKTRELRYNLDLERERQTQRELQRELELAESGVQVSRRDFSSSVSSRTRERYRDRDNGRSAHETSLRPSSSGRESSMQSSVPTVVLSGSSHRAFSNQPPTILQSRDRSNEQGAGYDDGIEGSRDSGDGGSIGDPDTGSGFDGLPGGTRRGGKSRQIADRRERDGRREGKWERKHS